MSYVVQRRRPVEMKIYDSLERRRRWRAGSKFSRRFRSLFPFIVIWIVRHGVEFSAVEGRCLSEKKAHVKYMAPIRCLNYLAKTPEVTRGNFEN